MNIGLTERSIISCLVLDKELMEGVDDVGITPNWFCNEFNKEIFNTLLSLRDSELSIDYVSIDNEIRKRGKIKNFKTEDLIEVCGTEISSFNFNTYVKQLESSVDQRDLLERLNKSSNIVLSNQFDDIDLARESIISLLEEGRIEKRKSNSVPMNSAVKELYSDLMIPKEEREKGIIKCDLPSVDKIVGGYEPGQLIIIAARPAMGKSAFTMQIGRSIASNYGKCVPFFSLEMTTKELTIRNMSSMAEVDGTKFKNNDFTHDELGKIAKAGAKLSEIPLVINDTSYLTPNLIKRECHKLVREHGELGAIAVDYLQLMSPNNSNAHKNDNSVITEISRSLKLLAKEFGCPVFAVSQLNRSVESRNDKRPLMADLRESGAIEQDADKILFIYRDEVYNPDTKEPNTAEVLIRKNRGGEIGTARTQWVGKYTSFSPLNTAEERSIYRTNFN